MSTFQYNALTSDGRMMKGTIEAASHDDANELLKDMQLVVNSIEKAEAEFAHGGDRTIVDHTLKQHPGFLRQAPRLRRKLRARLSDIPRHLLSAQGQPAYHALRRPCRV